MSARERPNRIDDLLPLSRVDFLVLLVLTDGERHGYGIVKEIEDRTEGKVQPLPGNLYAVMRRLMESGLVERAPNEAGSDSESRNRRYYQIADLGRRVLAADAAMMRSLVGEAAARDLIEGEA
ncbi:MAG: helix-turn-helix transcriptional regulator [Gemmatimonadetes bacterium]|nr:helix-turn-helix transcriptional regulator [Gemmatimonadota bacterium]